VHKVQDTLPVRMRTHTALSECRDSLTLRPCRNNTRIQVQTLPNVHPPVYGSIRFTLTPSKVSENLESTA